MPRLAMLALAFAALSITACDSYGDDEPSPTSTLVPEATTTPSTSGVREFGEAPVFWRTLDEFKTIRANVPYFVLFRITGGYDEPTLRVTAEKFDGTSDPVAYDVLSATPVGSDAEGEYFPVSLVLPSLGDWTISVDTGDDVTTLGVTVQP